MRPAIRKLSRHPALVLPSALLLALPLGAQVASSAADTPANLAKYDKNQNGRLDPTELEQLNADTANARPAALPPADPETGTPVQLSPFEVTAGQERGYLATNSMSGTRLNTKIEDLAASITVVTKQQLLDTASIDINDIFNYEANTEGTNQYTEFSLEGGYNEVTALSPQSSNRVRGLGSANMAIGNFAASSSIPVDSYNVEAVEISRGPNANIFGLGGGSGTVNLIGLQAKTNASSTQVMLRGDSYGGWRTSLDLNRPVIKDKLALRLAAVHEEKGYERKPAKDNTNRLTATFTARPFKTTTIRGSFESYRNGFSRPNTTLPRDAFSEWLNNGMPVWNPLYQAPGASGLPTGGWRYLDGTSYTAVAAGTEAQENPIGYPRGLLPNLNVFYARPTAYMDNGQITLYEMNRTSTTAAPGFGGATRYAESAGLRPNAFGVPGLPLFQTDLGITERDQYDYTSVNFLAPNFGDTRSKTYRVELEQFFVNTPRHQLAAQLGFYREDIETFDHNFISRAEGAPPNVKIDVNEFKFSGEPNPNFLRPYITGSEPNIRIRPELNDNYRSTLAYQLDLSQEKGLLRWVGKHRLAGYGELRRMIDGTLSARERIVSDHPWITGNDLLSLANRGVTFNMSPRYYLGGNVTEAGPVIDYAPSGPSTISGTRPFTWYGNSSTAPIVDTVTTDSVIYSGQKRKREIRTLGLVWQGFFWNDRIVPTAGWRYDRPREVRSPTLNSNPTSATTTIDPETRLNDLSVLDRFGTDWVENRGRTQTRGIVVKPLRWLNLHYNESDSFSPEPVAYNIYLEALPNPQSKGRDYGFSLNLFDGKLVARINRYEVTQENSRSGPTGGSFAQRTFRFFFDTGSPLTNFNVDSGTFGNGNDPWDLEQKGTEWIIARNPGISVDDARQRAIQEYLAPVGFDEAYIDQVRALGGSRFAEVNLAESTGWELELNYNPTNYWTMKLTGAQQVAKDSAMSQYINQFFSDNLPYLMSIQNPVTGGNWWQETYGTSTTGAPSTWYLANIATTLSQSSANAGKRRPQTREWRFAGTTNFRLSGVTENRWLKRLSVGGTVRWEDKAALGFYGMPAEPDGIIRMLDQDRPIWDKARFYTDVFASYDMRLFDKVRARLQLNVRNVFENGRLQPIAYNPDGQAWNYRIIDPRQFILTATFDL